MERESITQAFSSIISNNIISDNSASACKNILGIGIYNSGSSITISNNTILNNTVWDTCSTSSVVGGGIFSSSSAMINHNVIDDNIGHGIYGDRGAFLTITNNEINRNSKDGISVIEDSTITNNVINENYYNGIEIVNVHPQDILSDFHNNLEYDKR